MTRELDAKLHTALFKVPVEWRLCEYAPDCGNLEEMQDYIERNEADGFHDQRECATLHPCYNWLDTDGPRENGWDLDSITEEDRRSRWHPVPEYSALIECAWLVVEKMSEHYRVAIHQPLGGRGWQCVFEMRDGKMRFPIEVPHQGDAFANADTAPMAICNAALQALGVSS